jgi:hypothetical protein
VPRPYCANALLNALISQILAHQRKRIWPGPCRVELPFLDFAAGLASNVCRQLVGPNQLARRGRPGDGSSRRYIILAARPKRPVFEGNGFRNSENPPIRPDFPYYAPVYRGEWTGERVAERLKGGRGPNDSGELSSDLVEMTPFE